MIDKGLKARLVKTLIAATTPGARQRLVARGLARGIIWRDGVIPEGAPPFAVTLSTDLLDHGYSVLAHAMALRDGGEDLALVESSFRLAAEAIESAVRKGARSDVDRGFHIVAAAAAFHLGHFAARSYCLLPNDVSPLNLSSAELFLSLLMRRAFRELRTACLEWLRRPENNDDVVFARLSEDESFGLEDVLALSLTRNLCRALAIFDYALESGDGQSFAVARSLLVQGEQGASNTHFVPLWWANSLARHLIDDLWNHSLHQRLPILPDTGEGPAWNTVRSKFIASLASREMAQVDLWPSQTEAAQRSVDVKDNLVVALPTSAGKTRIAELCALRALASGKRVVYVTPLRALSAQVEATLGKTFRPLGYSVSSLYGAAGVSVADVGSLKVSAIVVATPEKLDFAIRQQPDVLDDVGLVVLDEGHMIGLGTREIRYEVLVQRLLKRTDAKDRRLVCLSAIFNSGETFDDFTAWLRNDAPGDPVRSDWRPTRHRPAILTWANGKGRLQFVDDEERPFVPDFVSLKAAIPPRRNSYPTNDQEFVIATAQVLVNDAHRVLIYCPQRRSVETLATHCIKLNESGLMPSFLKVPAVRLEKAIRIGIDWLGVSHVAVKALRLGIAVHHGALPRPFLTEIENLLNDKILPVAIASPTLAQGIDLSCSALIFRSIYRVGDETIPPSEYANVIGRSGRAYVDLDGLILFPIFASTSGAKKKLADFQKLRSDALSRSLESGMFMLLDEIMKRIAREVDGDADAFQEYVTNHATSWTTPGVDLANEKAAVGRSGPPQFEKPLHKLLDDLDAAILGTLDNLDGDVNTLADALDSALRSSLWQRRLARLDEEDQELQRLVLVGRATWIWKRSTPAQRRGFFAAGVGYEAGHYIDTNLNLLLPFLVEGEAAIVAGDAKRASTAACLLGEQLFKIHPFAPDHVPGRWQELIEAWLAGTSMGSILGSDSAEEIEFLQQGVVFRLVWAVEALRVHGVALERPEVLGLTGSLALALTYGAPSIQSSLLVEEGLSSRPMAVEVVTAYHATFSTASELREWVRTTDKQIQADNFWKSPERRQIWNEFCDRWSARTRSEWVSSEVTAGVNWNAGIVPKLNTSVRLVDDQKAGKTNVCDIDLIIIGTLRNRFSEAASGKVEARVEPGTPSAQLRIIRWGPPPR